jgi:hypothetical protein
MTGVVEGIRVDVRRLHESWMELFFPRQRTENASVLGKWEPETTSGKLAYRTWSVLGAIAVAVGYPLALVGVIARSLAAGADSTATRLGLAGTLGFAILVWGLLTVASYFRFSFSGFLAVLAAALVATICAGLAYLFTKAGGRLTTVLLAYPSAMTAIFLPPVVAAFYSPALGDVVFTGSENLAAWFLDNVFALGGINDYLRSEYDLTGVAYVLMWLGVSIPVGWFVGVLVTLANAARPSE